ncbi:hypothetical protein BD779DRAFT_1475450 [Infundibulicybe gibba]|nr:hypothetical protein BD779DRAFT_1475450 [Infundibulicybe gibba]
MRHPRLRPCSFLLAPPLAHACAPTPRACVAISGDEILTDPQLTSPHSTRIMSAPAPSVPNRHSGGQSQRTRSPLSSPAPRQNDGIAPPGDSTDCGEPVCGAARKESGPSSQAQYESGCSPLSSGTITSGGTLHHPPPSSPPSLWTTAAHSTRDRRTTSSELSGEMVQSMP